MLTRFIHGLSWTPVIAMLCSWHLGGDIPTNTCLLYILVDFAIFYLKKCPPWVITFVWCFSFLDWVLQISSFQWDVCALTVSSGWHFGFCNAIDWEWSHQASHQESDKQCFLPSHHWILSNSHWLPHPWISWMNCPLSKRPLGVMQTPLGHGSWVLQSSVWPHSGDEEQCFCLHSGCGSLWFPGCSDSWPCSHHGLMGGFPEMACWVGSLKSRHHWITWYDTNRYDDWVIRVPDAELGLQNICRRCCTPRCRVLADPCLTVVDTTRQGFQLPPLAFGVQSSQRPCQLIGNCLLRHVSQVARWKWRNTDVFYHFPAPQLASYPR